jgi:hypothetical protein
MTKVKKKIFFKKRGEGRHARARTRYTRSHGAGQIKGLKKKELKNNLLRKITFARVPLIPVL